MADHMESRLVVDALERVVQREFPEEGLVAHPDRGVQYASEHYQQLLSKHDITCSMSRKCNYWEATEAAVRRKAEGGSLLPAPMESFFATLKKELVHHEHALRPATASSNTSKCSTTESADTPPSASNHPPNSPKPCHPFPTPTNRGEV